MKKHFNLFKFLVLVACLASVLVVVGCSSKDSSESDYASSESAAINDEVTDAITSAFAENRKIHYDYTYYLESNDVLASIEKLNKAVQDNNGYIESNDYNEYDDITTSTYVVRIPSEKLNSFVSQFESGEKYTTKTIDSTDYTTQYVDTTARIQALEDSRARYAEMLEDPTISFAQIQNVNDKLVEIDSQLNALQIKKNKFDNLVEYSTVTIRFNQTAQEKFFDFLDGYGLYLYRLCQIVLAVILYTLPFALVAGGIVAAIIIPKAKKKKKAKLENNN